MGDELLWGEGFVIAASQKYPEVYWIRIIQYVQIAGII